MCSRKAIICSEGALLVAEVLAVEVGALASSENKSCWLMTFSIDILVGQKTTRLKSAARYIYYH